MAQDEATSVVFGVPAKAVRLEPAEHVLPRTGSSGSSAQWRAAGRRDEGTPLSASWWPRTARYKPSGSAFLLEGEGYEVQVAGNGRERLAAVSASAPDLIISDLVMPEMDGFAFCQAVKSSKATRGIPFVLLTAQQTPMDILRGLKRGADNFIPKPFEDHYLLERIKRIFENLGRRRKGRLGMEVTVRMGGRDIVVNADKQQMIELLFATSEELSDSNRHLEEARLALEEQARTLERKVEQRTREGAAELNAVVTDFETMLRRLIPEHIQLVTALQQGLGRVKADPSQIEQVIVNLAVNARDAMPQGGRLILETTNVDFAIPTCAPTRGRGPGRRSCWP